MDKKLAIIKSVLDKLYDKYNHRDLIKPDPLQFVYQYSNPRDKEITAILSAVLAYGRVQQIEKSLSKLLGILGDSPHAFVMNLGKKHEQKLKDFKHKTLLKKMSYQSQKMLHQSSKEDYLRIIEKIYNFNSKNKIRLNY